MPEVWRILTMCMVILVPFIRRRHIALPVVTTVLGLALALLYAAPFDHMASGSFVFSGMLSIDPFSQFFKVLLYVFTLFIVGQWLVISRARTSVPAHGAQLGVLVPPPVEGHVLERGRPVQKAAGPV